MDIVIGRDNSRLKITIEKKSFLFGDEGSVPQSVSREHCRVEVGADSQIVIYNLKATNATYVGGLSVSSKRVSCDDTIELGADKYRLDLGVIVSLASKESVSGTPQASLCNISQLRQTWQNYDETKLKNQIRERKMTSIRSVTGIFSMMAIGCSFIPAIADMPIIRTVMYSVAFVLTLYFFIMTYRASTRQPIFLKELDNKFRSEYICPNCKRFMGYQNYDELSRVGQCPACRSKFID